MLNEARSADPPQYERWNADTTHFTTQAYLLNLLGSSTQLAYSGSQSIGCIVVDHPARRYAPEVETENPTKISGNSGPEGSAALLRERELGTKAYLFSTFLVTQTPTPSNSAVPDPICDSPSTQERDSRVECFHNQTGLRFDNRTPPTFVSNVAVSDLLPVIRVLRQEPSAVVNIKEV